MAIDAANLHLIFINNAAIVIKTIHFFHFYLIVIVRMWLSINGCKNKQYMITYRL